MLGRLGSGGIWEELRGGGEYDQSALYDILKEQKLREDVNGEQ